MKVLLKYMLIFAMFFLGTVAVFNVDWQCYSATCQGGQLLERIIIEK